MRSIEILPLKERKRLKLSSNPKDRWDSLEVYEKALEAAEEDVVRFSEMVWIGAELLNNAIKDRNRYKELAIKFSNELTELKNKIK
jgi:hypothetical protein